MEHHIGIDVSLQLSNLCVLDATGKVVREIKVASEPEALVALLRRLGLPIARVGLDVNRHVMTSHSFAVTRPGSAPSASGRAQVDVPVERRYLLPDPGAKSLHVWAVLPILWIDQVVGASGPQGRWRGHHELAGA